MTIIQSNPNLIILNLENCGVNVLTDSVMSAIATLTQLKTLNIACVHSQITDDGLKGVIHHCRQLESLTLRQQPQTTATGLAELQYCPTLKHLAIIDSSKLEDTVWQALSHIITLTHLFIQRCSGFSEKGVLKIQSLINLEYLGLFSIPEITDLCLKQIVAHCPKLCSFYQDEENKVFAEKSSNSISVAVEKGSAKLQILYPSYGGKLPASFAK